jgi:tetratricopeptide (TPR) repeat protein
MLMRLQTPKTVISNSIPDLLNRGVALHRQKRFREAEFFYQSVLRRQPDHPEANNLMGTLAAAEAKKASLAVDFFKRAVAGNAAITFTAIIWAMPI